MSQDSYLQKIHHEFPELTWNKHEIITHGWDHVIVILDKTTVFRFPKVKKYKDELVDEISLLRHLKDKVEVGIPDYIYIANDHSFAGYKILAGQELKPELFNQLSDTDKEMFSRQLADFISTLHSTPESIVKRFKVTTYSVEDEFADLVKGTQEFLYPRLNTIEIQIIREYFVELRDGLNLKHSNKMVHNDLYSSHLLWDTNKKLLNIIDFSDRGFDDPAHDFAELWDYGDEFVDKVYSMYVGEKDDMFLYRSKLYSKRIPLYVMKGALDGYPVTFDYGYKMFLERFRRRIGATKVSFRRGLDSESSSE